MRLKAYTLLLSAGFLAGCLNGLFGAGGGLVLIPLLGICGILQQDELFPASVSIMVPICILTLMMNGREHPLPWREALPYLLGSGLGGIGCGLWGKKIPVLWLHRTLGILIIWGGIRYLC